MTLTILISSLVVAIAITAVIVWLLANRKSVSATAKSEALAQNLAHLQQELLQQQSQAQEQQKLLSEALENQAELRASLAGLEQNKKALQSQLEKTDNELQKLRSENTSLLQDNSRLSAEQAEKTESFKTQLAQFSEQKQMLSKEFENLANKIFTEKGQQFSQSSQQSMDAILKPFKQQIDGFQQRINQIHSESLKGHTNLEAEIRKVLDVGLKMHDEASNLTKALKGDSQQRGAWGEAQLERTLQMSGLTKGFHYSSQDSFSGADGSKKRTDYVIRLPGDKCLIIDSKMTLPDYDRAIAADTEQEASLAMKAHVAAVRRHIDDLAKKDYTQITGLESPDFILMFMPVEPAYIEALKHDKELFGYGYQKSIVLVSHTTLIPILRTVSNLWIVEQSNREAKELGDKALEIYNSVCTVALRAQDLGKTLNTAGNHYNKLVTGLVGNQGLAGKVERFSELSNKAKKQMVEPEKLTLGGDDSRLQLEAKPLPERENDNGLL